MNLSVEPDCSGHPELNDPTFEDVPYYVELRTEANLDNRFECRVRRWDVDLSDTEKPKFLMISGIGHNCNFFNPLVKCMSLEQTGGNVSQIYAIDLPGHGASRLPPNVKFGMLRLEDYVAAIQQIMTEINTQGISLKYIVAHSMGGMLVMLLEKKLLSMGKSLHDYGVEGIILLASALPERVDWSLGEGRIFKRGVPVNLLSTLLPYVTFSPRYLLHARLFDEDFVKQFFGVEDDEGNVSLAPGAPAGDALKILNDAESYVALSQLGGLDFETGGKLKRPEIDQGIFAGYTLGVSGYTKDVLFLPKEEAELCEYLAAGKGIYKTIDHAYAVHDDPYSCPCETFKFIKEALGI
jgi:pimeloyl-ACP methyl ester carboxylesterase